jgi:hypothetical protein
VERIIGPMLGKLYVPNPQVFEYGFILRFPAREVVTSQQLMRALNKLQNPKGTILVAGQDFTIEAREAAEESSCDIISAHEFGWTDATYLSIRQR